jgi:hypothetical protein
MVDRAAITLGSGHPHTAGHWDDSLFVGRQAEMAALQAALEDTLASRGRLVLLGGEPGIGKTRTVREFARHAEGRGSLVLWGRCAETPGAPPYWPWSQMIRSYARAHDATVLRVDKGAGAVDLVTLAPEVQEHLTDLPPSAPIEDPEQARFRLFTSMIAFLRQASPSASRRSLWHGGRRIPPPWRRRYGRTITRTGGQKTWTHACRRRPKSSP